MNAEAIADIVGAFVDVQGNSSLTFGEKISLEIGIPYLKERESDRTKDSEPTSYDNLHGALKRIKNPTGIYYHYPSMNLVFVDGNQRIGIRSCDISILGMSLVHDSFVSDIRDKIKGAK